MRKMLWALGMLVWCGTAAAGIEEAKRAYHNGDFKAAFEEFQRLADQGDAHAQYNLGVMYRKGNGVAQDDKQAVAWYRKAAAQGLADAQGNLGFMYYTGHGVAKDNAQALEWYRKSAEQGDSGSQVNVGGIYEDGAGVPVDLVRAHMWYSLAAASGDQDGIKWQKEVAAKMDAGQVREAQRQAREWTAAHAKGKR